MTCISLFYIFFFRIPAGFAIDKYGAKGVLQLGVLMSLLSLGLMAISSGFPTQLLARVVLGVATSAAWMKRGLLGVIECQHRDGLPRKYTEIHDIHEIHVLEIKMFED